MWAQGVNGMANGLANSFATRLGAALLVACLVSAARPTTRPRTTAIAERAGPSGQKGHRARRRRTQRPRQPARRRAASPAGGFDDQAVGRAARPHACLQRDRGSIRVFDDKGEPLADIAYTSYQLDGAER